MKIVSALFPNPTEAERAIKKLEDAGLDVGNAQIHSQHTIESQSTVRAMPNANTAVSGGATPVGPAGIGAGSAAGNAVLTDDTIETYLANIGIEGEEMSFFKHGIREGGNIVVIQTENENADDAKRALEAAGGRLPQVE